MAKNVSSSNIQPVQVIASVGQIAAQVNQVIQQWAKNGYSPAPVEMQAMPDGNLIVALSPKPGKSAHPSPPVFGVSMDVKDWVRGKLFNNTGFKGFVVSGSQVVYWGTTKNK
jgi:hypothetical protein